MQQLRSGACHFVHVHADFLLIQQPSGNVALLLVQSLLVNNHIISRTHAQLGPLFMQVGGLVGWADSPHGAQCVTGWS